MFRCCSMWRNSPEALAAFILHASGEPFERRPWAFVVPQYILCRKAVRRPVTAPHVHRSRQKCAAKLLHRSVSAPATRVPSDKVMSTGSDEFPCRFSEIGRGSSCKAALCPAYMKLPVK